MASRFTGLLCERCNAPAADHGVTYDACHHKSLRALLASKGWCEVAATRTGDRPGESLLDTIRREAGVTR